MKKYKQLSAICMIVFVLVAPQFASAQLSSITGSYGYSVSGYDSSFGPQLSIAGLLVFDGAGHITVTDSVNAGGTVTRFESYPGTYYVNAQGVGSLTMHSGVSGVPVDYDFVLVNGGTQILLICTDDGYGVTGIATKQ